MQQEDLPAVAGIELETLSSWSLLALERELAVANGRQLVILSPDSKVVGWCACRTVWPEAEMLKIAVIEAERHRGLGSLLLDSLLEDLQKQDYGGLFLEVRAKNTPALLFYEKHGFRQVGKRMGYYADPDDDALILQKDIATIQSYE
jgi:ribosomal-protein-alanine N-acetyltransferase